MLAYYNRGLSKSKIGDNQGAIDDYSKAIQINPQYIKAYFNRGNCKSKLGDKEGAISDYSATSKSPLLIVQHPFHELKTGCLNLLFRQQ